MAASSLATDVQAHEAVLHDHGWLGGSVDQLPELKRMLAVARRHLLECLAASFEWTKPMAEAMRQLRVDEVETRFFARELEAIRPRQFEQLFSESFAERVDRLAERYRVYLGLTPWSEHERYAREQMLEERRRGGVVSLQRRSGRSTRAALYAIARAVEGGVNRVIAVNESFHGRRADQQLFEDLLQRLRPALPPDFTVHYLSTHGADARSRRYPGERAVVYRDHWQGGPNL